MTRYFLLFDSYGLVIVQKTYSDLELHLVPALQTLLYQVRVTLRLTDSQSVS
jgi:hypothetical protein